MIPNFSSFLLNCREPIFGDSTVLSSDGSVIDKSYRDSQTAFYELPTDPLNNDGHALIRCIEQRAAQFQGHIPIENIENLQAVKYHPILLMPITLYNTD